MKATQGKMIRLSHRVWSTESESENRKYFIFYNGKNLVCQCKGFLYSLKYCKHIKYLKSKEELLE